MALAEREDASDQLQRRFGWEIPSSWASASDARVACHAFENAHGHECRELPIGAFDGDAVACPEPPSPRKGTNRFPNVLVLEREASLRSAVRLVPPHQLHGDPWETAPETLSNALGQDPPGMAARSSFGNGAQNLQVRVGATHIQVVYHRLDGGRNDRYVDISFRVSSLDGWGLPCHEHDKEDPKWL